MSCLSMTLYIIIYHKNSTVYSGKNEHEPRHTKSCYKNSFYLTDLCKGVSGLYLKNHLSKLMLIPLPVTGLGIVIWHSSGQWAMRRILLGGLWEGFLVLTREMQGRTSSLTGPCWDWMWCLEPWQTFQAFEFCWFVSSFHSPHRMCQHSRSHWLFC